MEVTELLIALSSSKVEASRKIELYHKLDKILSNSSEKDQYLIDSLCSCIDGLSSKDKVVLENRDVINEMLLLFKQKIESAIQNKRKYHLNGNIYDALGKFMKHADIFDRKLLYTTWNCIMEVEDWNKVLLSKSNVISDLLHLVCQYFVEGSNEENNEEHTVLLLNHLFVLFIKQKRYQFNVKKVFQTFCENLLILVLCVQSKLQLKQGNELVLGNIDELLTMIIGHRDNLSNLKTLAVPPAHMETPAKKMKHLAYFEVFFEKIRDASVKRRDFLVQSVSSLYKIIIKASRLSNSFTSHEEFKILKMLYNEVKMSEQVDQFTVDACLGAFTTVLDFDVYKRIEDTGNVNSEWMTDLLRITLSKYNSSDTKMKTKMLRLFKTIFLINHSSAEPFLTNVLESCIESKVTDEDQQTTSEEVVNTLLETYGELRKLEYLLDKLPMETKGDISIPTSFISRFCQLLVNLQTSQITRLLEMFDRKSDVLLEEISEKNMMVLQHFTYLMFYCVISNASVIPENMFMRPDLQKLIELILSIYEKFHKMSSQIKRHKEVQDKFDSIILLIHIGVNEVLMLLQELSLYEMDDTVLLKPGVVVNEESNPLLKYLKVWQTMDEMRFRQIPYDKEFLSQILKNSLKKTLEFDKYNFQIFSIDDDTLWTSIGLKVLDNIELFLFQEDGIDNSELTEEAVGFLWKLQMNSKRLKVPASVRCILKNSTVYNYPSFQSNLVKQIKGSLRKVLGKEWQESMKPMSLKQATVLTNILKCIEEIRTEYFTQDNWQSLFQLISSVFSLVKETDKMMDTVGVQSVRLLDKLFEDSQTARHCSCDVSFVECFGGLVDFYTTWVKSKNTKTCGEDVLLHVFHSFIQLTIIHVDPCTDDLKQIHQKLYSTFKDKEFEFVTVQLIKLVLEALYQMVEMNNKSKKMISVFTLLQLLMQSIQNDIDILIGSYRDSLYTIFALFCKSFERLSRNKDCKAAVEEVKESLSQFSKEIATLLKKEIENVGQTKSLHKDCLQVLSFVNTKSDLAAFLRTNMEFDGNFVTKNLILAHQKDINNKHLPGVISKLILSMNNEQLQANLHDLSCKLDGVNASDGQQIYVIGIWKALLSCQWEKEQREKLWEVLPKVILVSVNVLCHGENDIVVTKALLKILSLAISLCKGSPVSLYTSSIYHIFNDASQLLHTESFKEDFEELYQILDLILFMHTSTFASTIHCFIESLNNLFLALVKRCNYFKETDDVEYCFARVSRLYNVLGSYKETISKFTPYIISGYISICSKSSISLKHKKILDDGIYSVFDACTNQELTMMSAVLENAEREHFRELRTFYEKHRKFSG